MLNGRCPSCGSAAVHSTVGGLFIKGDNSVAAALIGRSAHPVDYVCGDCGYWERHLPPGRVLDKIRTTWPRVRPATPAPSDDPQDAVPGPNA
jgi:hypothetical protein